MREIIVITAIKLWHFQVKDAILIHDFKILPTIV